MGGEAERDPVPPFQPPAKDDGEQVALQEAAMLYSRISISGTDGASPARKVERLTVSRSSANRTGTSKRKPARTTAPTTGAWIEFDHALRIEQPAAFQRLAIDRDVHGARDRTGDPAHLAAIMLDQREGRSHAVARAEQLIGGAGHARHPA